MTGVLLSSLFFTPPHLAPVPVQVDTTQNHCEGSIESTARSAAELEQKYGRVQLTCRRLVCYGLRRLVLAAVLEPPARSESALPSPTQESTSVMS